MSKDIIKAKWFNDSNNVIGVVRVVTENLCPCYFIGTGRSGNHIEDDIEYILAWGARFPTPAGDVLFANK